MEPGADTLVYLTKRQLILTGVCKESVTSLPRAIITEPFRRTASVSNMLRASANAWFPPVADVLATGALESAIAFFLSEHRGPPLGSLPEGELT
jgi:hypothetical protein